MKREIRIARIFLKLVQQEGYSLHNIMSRGSAAQAEFVTKYPMFAFASAYYGTQKRVIVFQNFDFVMKVARPACSNLYDEKRIYRKAKEYGVGNFFLPNHKICCGHMTVYIQKKVMPVETKLSFSEIQSYLSPRDNEDELWHYIFPEKLRNFVLQEYIMDLHNENWGFSKRNNILLFDYGI